MNRVSSFKPRLRMGIGLVLAAVIFAASIAFVTGTDTNTPDANTAPKAQPPTKVIKKKLTGAELYAINCNRCHAERYPTEFTSAQWKTLVTHMRVRANLPAAQAKLILKYLQEDSGN